MKNDYKIKDLIKETLSTIKESNYRIWYISFGVFSIIGIVTMALSFYYTLAYITPLLFTLLCFAIAPVMEVYASKSLKENVHYSLKTSASATSYGYYHLIFSYLKAYLFGTILAGFVWGIVVSVVTIYDPNIYDELLNIFSMIIYGQNLPSGLILEISSLAFGLLRTYNFLIIIFVYAGFLLSNRKNELSNAFSSAYLNDDSRFFLFNPLRKNIFNLIYRNFKRDYNKKTFWSKIIGMFLFTGGTIGGTFIGFAIHGAISTSDPFYFGLGLGFILYALWYGVERTVDANYIYDNISYITSRIPNLLANQLASVKAIYKLGFPNGRFDSNSFPMNAPQNVKTRFTEETLKKYFFLHYSEKIIDVSENVEFTEYAPKMDSEEENKSKDNFAGAFGLDDFLSDSDKKN